MSCSMSVYLLFSDALVASLVWFFIRYPAGSTRPRPRQLMIDNTDRTMRGLTARSSIYSRTAHALSYSSQIILCFHAFRPLHGDFNSPPLTCTVPSSFLVCVSPPLLPALHPSGRLCPMHWRPAERRHSGRQGLLRRRSKPCRPRDRRRARRQLRQPHRGVGEGRRSVPGGSVCGRGAAHPAGGLVAETAQRTCLSITLGDSPMPGHKCW